MHAHSPTEVAALMAGTEQEEGVERPQSAAAAADGMALPSPMEAANEVAAEGETRESSLAAAFGGEAAALGKEGWWLVVESLRGHLNLNKAGMKDTEPVHNSMVGRQALSPSLDDPQWCADVEFDAPTTPGEYKIVVHVRSSTMIGARPLGRRATATNAKASRHSRPHCSVCMCVCARACRRRREA